MQHEPSSGSGGRPSPVSPLTISHGHVARSLAIVLAPLMVGILAALFLAVPDQTREIYRIFARDYALQAQVPLDGTWHHVLQLLWSRAAYAPIDLSWIGVALGGVLNWQLARNLTLEFAREELVEDSVRGFSLRWLPRVCGALIPFGAGTGLMLAAQDVRGLPFDLTSLPVAAREVDAAQNLFFAGLVFHATAVLLLIYAWLRTRKKRHKYIEANRRLFSWPVVGLMIVVTLALVALFATPLTQTFGVEAAWALGTPALFCVFIMLLAYFATGLSVATFRTGVPIIPLLALTVLLIAIFDFNDNHVMPVRASASAIEKPTTREAFRRWYQSRADRQIYERAGKPYPVFLVTAAGGGLYAADFAATGLARLQDGCAAFAQHVFAISGVSGGALGAAMFASLVADVLQVKSDAALGLDPCGMRATKRPSDPTSIEARVSALVQQDYLSPMVAAGLFPDFLQRFLPFPIAQLDRSRAFEVTLDHVWKRTHATCTGGHCAPFSRPFLETWRADGTAPALVLNTTNVDIGYRTVISPFAIARDVPGEYSAIEDFHETLINRDGTARRGIDVTLGAAVGLSARFPWVMPAATIRSTDGERSLRVIDGGIFENSGVDTLGDMLIDLKPLEVAPDKRTAALRDEPYVVFHPLVISGYELSGSGDGNSLRGEALSPVSAMLAARVQRAGMASYRLFLERGYNCGKADQSLNCRENGLRFLVLNHVDFRLPLGWQLSDFTRRVVVSHVGTAAKCDPIPRIRSMFTGGRSPELRHQRQQFTQRENDCTACAVVQAIRGAPLAGSRLCR